MNNGGGSPSAYLGIAVPNFPSLFLIHGPNTFTSTNSNILMKELQIDCIMRWLRLLATREGSLDVRPEVLHAYQRHIRQRIQRTVFVDCHSWYVNTSGEVTNPWPGSTRDYARLLRQAGPDDFTWFTPRRSGAR